MNSSDNFVFLQNCAELTMFDKYPGVPVPFQNIIQFCISKGVSFLICAPLQSMQKYCCRPPQNNLSSKWQQGHDIYEMSDDPQ